MPPAMPMAAAPAARAARNIDPKALRPVLRLDVPLMISLLEYARETASTDIELHKMVENMIELCEYGEVLEMEDYEEIIEPLPIMNAPAEPDQKKPS